MSRKPEAVFKEGVHKHLPKEVYRVGMANPYAGGLPDVYYDGPRSDLWVEYKFIEKLPAKGLHLLDLKTKPCVSQLQYDWLTRRYDNGGNAVVILGWGPPRKKVGAIIGVADLNDWHPKEWYEGEACTQEELAEWIYQYTQR